MLMGEVMGEIHDRDDKTLQMGVFQIKIAKYSLFATLISPLLTTCASPDKQLPPTTLHEMRPITAPSPVPSIAASGETTRAGPRGMVTIYPDGTVTIAPPQDLR